jgi:hypothetical protein
MKEELLLIVRWSSVFLTDKVEPIIFICAVILFITVGCVIMMNFGVLGSCYLLSNLRLYLWRVSKGSFRL